jgi:hypothetical protein
MITLICKQTLRGDGKRDKVDEVNDKIITKG